MAEGGRDLPEFASRQNADVDALLGPDAKLAAPLGRPWAKLLLALGVLVLVAGALWLVLARTAGTAPRWVTERARVGDITVTVTATGSVQPTNQVDVSSELSGTVRKVFVDYNSAVTAGQTLAELDTDKLRATLEASRAKLLVAQARRGEAAATLRETLREYERKKALVERSIVADRELDVAWAAHERAVAALSSAEAEVEVAAAEVKLNETNLAKARIVSPINGVVLIRNVDPGQTVASTLQAPVLFSIAEDLREMEVQVDVDEADVGKVREGQHATFTVDAYPERRFPAVIRKLRFASEVIQGVVTYKAILVVDNSELLLRPGMTATAEITVEEVKEALLVPNAALRFTPPESAPERESPGFLRSLLPGPPRFRPPTPREERGSARRIWVLRGGVPAPVDVTVGASDGRYTEIRAGELAPDEEVVVDAVLAGS